MICVCLPDIMENSINCHGKILEFYYQISVGTVSVYCVSDKRVQCSVCMEDLKLAEEVRQLPCNHLYHHDCIVPWLELVCNAFLLSVC